MKPEQSPLTRTSGWRLVHRGSVFIGMMSCLAPFIACAGSDSARQDDGPDLEDAAPDRNEPPESGLPDGSVTEDALAPGRCSAGGFCYEPVPVQKSLLAVSGSSRDEVWAIASEGLSSTYGGDAILRWDGAAWNIVYQLPVQPNGVLTGFSGIWAPKHDDVWVYGENILRYSKAGGVRQLPIPVPPGNEGPPLAGWATPTSDALWTVGTYQTNVFRYREEPGGTLVVDSWSPQFGAGCTWSGLWGFAADDIYVAGRACSDEWCSDQISAVLGHYDGMDWSFQITKPGYYINSIFGTPPGQPRHLWITSQNMLTGVSVTELLPVKDDGTIGEPVFTQSLTTSGAPGAVHGWAVSPNAGWLSNHGLVWQWTGAELKVTPTAINGLSAGEVLGLWAASADEAWIVGRTWYSGVAIQSGASKAFAARRGGQPTTNGGQR